MRMRLRRFAVLAVLAAAGPLLAGCENFDPDSLDFFHLNEKKKLPGERKELFPGGVPGVSQGVPPEYLKGNQQQPDAAADATLPPGAKVNPGDEDASAALKPKTDTASVEAAQPAEPPKPKVKRKPKPQTAQHAPAQVTVQPTAQQPASAQQAQPAWPAPPPPQPPQQAQPAQSPWPAANQPADNSPWPAPPAPGTFSR
jgi:hypothetical protein